MKLRVLLTAILCAAGCPVKACAERPPQDRNKADRIVVGVVEAVSETWSLQTDYYRVRLRVTEVERAIHIAPGEQFEVTCFRWSRPWPLYAGAAGHKGIPAIGDRVRVYAFWHGTGYEGAYPDWYDVLQPSPRNWLVRQWDARKVRVTCYIVLIAVSLAFAVWWVRRRRTRTVMFTPPAPPEPSGDGAVPPVDRSPK